MLPENEKYQLPLVGTVEDRKMVAIKKSKVNTFNDRDGVLFYALREAQILQKLKGHKYVCQLLDIYYSGDQKNSISLVMEYLDSSLEKLQDEAFGSKKRT